MGWLKRKFDIIDILAENLQKDYGERKEMSINHFDVSGDMLYIKHEKWGFVALATVRDDYIDEITSVTWSKKGKYLYCGTLDIYLHIYIMQKWYGEEECQKMHSEGYVVDHMDNNGYNCCINNLCFLTGDENKAKGMTVDKLSKDKTYIALSLYKDFTTGLIQMTVFFNYPAVLKLTGLDRPAMVELVYLLYDAEYEMVLNDARTVLYDYRREYSFAPEMLHNADYHIEGCYGVPCTVEVYDRYKESQGSVGMISIGPLRGWTLNDKHQFIHIRKQYK